MELLVSIFIGTIYLPSKYEKVMSQSQITFLSLFSLLVIKTKKYHIHGSLIYVFLTIWFYLTIFLFSLLSNDVASGSNITPVNKIDKQLVA